MATRTMWIRSLSPCVPYPRDISASCLTLRRFISRRKARFIFFIHHGNCDPKHSSQHRIISARGARKILLDTFYLPPSRSNSHITKIAPNNITHPTGKASKALFYLCLFRTYQSGRFFFGISFTFGHQTRLRSLPDGGFAFRLGHERLKSAFPLYVSRFPSSEFFAQSLHGPCCTTRSRHCFVDACIRRCVPHVRV